jgi:hypothetical protein
MPRNKQGVCPASTLIPQGLHSGTSELLLNACLQELYPARKRCVIIILMLGYARPLQGGAVAAAKPPSTVATPPLGQQSPAPLHCSLWVSGFTGGAVYRAFTAVYRAFTGGAVYRAFTAVYRAFTAVYRAFTGGAVYRAFTGGAVYRAFTGGAVYRAFRGRRGLQGLYRRRKIHRGFLVAAAGAQGERALLPRQTPHESAPCGCAIHTHGPRVTGRPRPTPRFFSPKAKGAAGRLGTAAAAADWLLQEFTLRLPQRELHAS